MNQLRCLTLDVDQPALAEVTYLLDTDQRVGRVQSTPSIEAAADIVRRESIDVVFVCLVHHSIEEARRLTLSAHTRPKFVALARDDAHAMSAFDMGALDYIVKPITRNALDRALDRLLSLTPQPTSADRIVAEQSGVTHFIDRRDILWVQASGDYTLLTTHQGDFTCRSSLTSLTERLVPYGFQRVHRQWLVPIMRIETFTQTGTCAAITVAGQEIPVSRRSLQELKSHLM